eukprot:79142-Chlamydomonas_euryale.AAC.1
MRGAGRGGVWVEEVRRVEEVWVEAVRVQEGRTTSVVGAASERGGRTTSVVGVASERGGMECVEPLPSVHSCPAQPSLRLPGQRARRMSQPCPNHALAGRWPVRLIAWPARAVHCVRLRRWSRPNARCMRVPACGACGAGADRTHGACVPPLSALADRGGPKA